MSKESKTYRIYNPITKRIVVNKDVAFVENEGWEWNKTESGDKNVLEWGDNERSETKIEEVDEIDEGHGEVDEVEAADPVIVDETNPTNDEDNEGT